MAETRYKLPVYRTWPDRSYTVIGSVSFEDPKANWDEGIIEKAVDEGKERQADAIIIRQGNELAASRITGMAQDPIVWYSNYQTTALLIKWKSDSEISAERASLQNLKASFRRNHPTYARFEGIDLAIELLRSQGVALDTPEAEQKLSELAESLSKPADAPMDGKWMFRCKIERSSVASSYSENLYGLASVKLTGDSLVIVSLAGQTELNFSGSYNNGRLVGKGGLGTTPLSKAEGVATPEKISITGEGRTADSVLQANIVLQR